MKRRLFSLLPALLGICLPVSVFAQKSDHYIIPAQGGFSKGESMSISWTIGDLATETTVLSEAIVTHGFQQPIITVKEVISEHSSDLRTNHQNAQGQAMHDKGAVEFNATVYPNPAGAAITVNIDNSHQEYNLEIFDATGNLLSRIKSSSPQEVLNLYNLPADQYLLRISLENTNQSKTFQIIKSN